MENRPFDLEAAKANNIVCTRDGRKARILTFERKSENYPIVALVENERGGEDAYNYTLHGRFLLESKSGLDLMMPPEKQEGWINLYKSGKDVHTGGAVYDSKDAAMIVGSGDDNYLKSIKINWGEE